MDKAIMVAVLPLAMGALVYVGQVLGYQLVLNRPWMALTFLGYVIANVGLLMDALSGGTDKVTVGAPYYNATFTPLMAPLLVLMALGPLMSWKRADLPGVLSRLRFALGISILGMLTVWYLREQGPVLAIFGIGIGIWLICGALTDLAERTRLFRVPLAASLARAAGLPRASWGAMMAHSGVGVVVLGITASTAWTEEKIILMQPGDEATVSGYVYRFVRAEQGPGPNYTALRGQFEVSRNGAPVVSLAPEARSYPTPPMDTTEAAIYPMLSGDLFAVIGNPQGDNGWSARLYFRPLQSWIWAGAIIMTIGGMISLSDRRHRVGAPQRAPTPYAGGAPAAVPAE